MPCESQNFDGTASGMTSGPWLGILGACQPVEHSYNASDHRAAYDMQYCQAADNRLVAYLSLIHI